MALLQTRPSSQVYLHAQLRQCIREGELLQNNCQKYPVTIIGIKASHLAIKCTTFTKKPHQSYSVIIYKYVKVR